MDDDEDSDDAPRGGRHKGKLDGKKMEKEKKKRSAEAANFMEEIGEIMKSKEAMMERHS